MNRGHLNHKNHFSREEAKEHSNQKMKIQLLAAVYSKKRHLNSLQISMFYAFTITADRKVCILRRNSS
jgi:hypothetical protein